MKKVFIALVSLTSLNLFADTAELKINLDNVPQDTVVVLCDDEGCEESLLGEIDQSSNEVYALIDDSDSGEDESETRSSSHLKATLFFIQGAVSSEYARRYVYQNLTMTEMANGPSLFKKLTKRLFLPVTVVSTGLILGKFLNKIEGKYLTFGGYYPEGIFSETGRFWGNALYDFLND